MLNKILESHIYKIITQKIGLDKINEMRFRENKPIVLNIAGRAYFLNEQGLITLPERGIKATKKMIEDIIYKASEFSIYSVNEELKQGYLVLDGGERIGVCGTFVTENKKIKTITNFTSLNIRIPHEIKNASLSVFKFLYQDNSLKNTLIISPPGLGKTTFIRDFVLQLTNKNLFYNVLIIDERGEIAGKNNKLQVGNFCDIISFSDKANGFLQGIRAMNPDLIVTDELGQEEDFDAINFAVNSGVKILATIHAESISQLRQKKYFSKIDGLFERFVVLKKGVSPGTIEGIYNSLYQKIYSGNGGIYH